MRRTLLRRRRRLTGALGGGALNIFLSNTTIANSAGEVTVGTLTATGGSAPYTFTLV